MLCSLLASAGPGSSPLGPLLCGSPLGGVLSQNLQGMLPLLGPPVFGAGGLPGVMLVLRSCPWDPFVALCPLPDPSSYPQPFSCAVWRFRERARGGQGHLRGWPLLALPCGLPLSATAPFSISDGRRRLASPSPPTRCLLGIRCVPGTVTVLRVCPRTEHGLALSPARGACRRLAQRTWLLSSVPGSPHCSAWGVWGILGTVHPPLETYGREHHCQEVI